LEDQLDVLKTSYEPHAIQFNLVNTTRTINRNWTDENWSNPDSGLEMKKALRMGGYDALNIYFVNMTVHTLGVSHPNAYSEDSWRL
jgi:hypothetical protein